MKRSITLFVVVLLALLTLNIAQAQTTPPTPAHSFSTTFYLAPGAYSVRLVSTFGKPGAIYGVYSGTCTIERQDLLDGPRIFAADINPQFVTPTLVISDGCYLTVNSGDLDFGSFGLVVDTIPAQ